MMNRRTFVKTAAAAIAPIAVGTAWGATHRFRRSTTSTATTEAFAAT